MDLHHHGMGNGGGQDHTTTTPEQDAQFTTLTNLAQLIQGSEPSPGPDTIAQPVHDGHIAPTAQGMPIHALLPSKK